MSDCTATVNLADDRTLTCVLPAGHDGPVHQDERGEAWGDPHLPPPTLPQSGVQTSQ